MILDRTENLQTYLFLNTGLAKAREFFWRQDLLSLPDGSYALDGKKVFAIVSRNPGRTRENANLEAHRQYLDLQVVLCGTETMGWKSRALCGAASREYNPERDVEFFADEPDVWLTVPAGSFAVFLPDDTHMPGLADGVIHKVVFKLALAPV